jgi:6-pyruvoyltetrahydropterin/6-carboxytetrahydropterin synthase
VADTVHEVGSSIRVRAFHVMPGMEAPEGTLHAHDYRIDVVVERDELDERFMVCDLDMLDAALQEVADEVRDADLERIRPADVPAVTVEVFSRWAHGRLAGAVRAAGGQRLAVRVWESDTAFGGYRDAV